MWHTWAVPADFGLSITELAYLGVVGWQVPSTYIKISVCFHDWLAARLGMLVLKFFVYIFVQMANMFADMATVSEVL